MATQAAAIAGADECNRFFALDLRGTVWHFGQVFHHARCVAARRANLEVPALPA